jgi:hypothetical protein
MARAALEIGMTLLALTALALSMAFVGSEILIPGN